ncbi:FAT3 [Bugula neritina]|uniref:FAT3 n=1 Tax=Bugula neritina TaxID=10212 RepID=A0A7J7J9H8_BUGNE|nr:FAT3 [Bugula neritina]
MNVYYHLHLRLWKVHLLRFFSVTFGSQSGCDLHPCQHGGTCTQQAIEPYFSCSCTRGFNGFTCEDDIDECIFDNPCRNGGLCVNIFGGYECHCGPSWEGPQCENLVKKCAAYPCFNGAQCTDVGEDFYCTCAAGYRGELCADDIDECEEITPCLNGGTCENLSGSYNCSCPPGYTGVDCEVNIDECQLYSACKNGATCSDLVNGYACLCAPGYAGKYSICISVCPRLCRFAL